MCRRGMSTSVDAELELRLTALEARILELEILHARVPTPASERFDRDELGDDPETDLEVDL